MDRDPRNRKRLRKQPQQLHVSLRLLLTVENVRAAAKQIESYLKSNGRALEFRVDSDTRQLVVTVRDPETGETIRQIPTEEVLQLARTLSKSADASAPTLVDVSA